MLLAGGPADAWLQWGGPTRNFQAAPVPLADAWPADGPRVVWKRDLGVGFSSIVTDGRTLYTLFKRDKETVVIALDAASGKTVWEQAVDAEPNAAEAKEMDLQHGLGPGSTPLISGDKLFAVTFMGRLLALDRATGRIVWSQELIRRLGGTIVSYGYANSPIADEDKIILPVGGKGHALMAFRMRDGSVAWQSGDSDNANSSPIHAKLLGEDQIIVQLQDELMAVNPATGAILWRHPHREKSDIEASDPVVVSGDTLIAASLNIGAREIQLKRENGKITATEVWTAPKMRVMHGNMLRIGDCLYASNGGGFGPTPLAAMRISDGAIAWQERKFLKSALLGVGDKTIILEEDGRLLLATLSPEGMKTLAEAEVLSEPAWTPPTLVGTRLYLRDTKSIVALDFSR